MDVLVTVSCICVCEGMSEPQSVCLCLPVRGSLNLCVFMCVSGVPLAIIFIIP